MPNTKNFGYSTVLTAPSPASSGTSLVVQSADGAKFPSVPFNATVWPAGAQALSSNAEIVTVTAISTDTFTITRQAESTSARSILVGDQIDASITAGLFPAGTVVGTSDAQTLTNKEISGGVVESNVFTDFLTTQSITLPASRNFSSTEPIEVSGSYSLEVPATSSLEIAGYATQDQVNTINAGASQAVVATSETTAVQTFGNNLATSGPAVTVNIKPSGLALVFIYARQGSNSATSNRALTGFALSGANVQASNDNLAIDYQVYATGAAGAQGATFLLTGLIPGSTTFTLQYRVTGDTGTWSNRRIAVVPL